MSADMGADIKLPPPGKRPAPSQLREGACFRLRTTYYLILTYCTVNVVLSDVPRTGVLTPEAGVGVRV